MPSIHRQNEPIDAGRPGRRLAITLNAMLPMMSGKTTGDGNPELTEPRPLPPAPDEITSDTPGQIARTAIATPAQPRPTETIHASTRRSTRLMGCLQGSNRGLTPHSQILHTRRRLKTGHPTVNRLNG